MKFWGCLRACVALVGLGLISFGIVLAVIAAITPTAVVGWIFGGIFFVLGLVFCVAAAPAKVSRPAGVPAGESDGYYTKVVGVTFEGRQQLLFLCKPGERLQLVRDPKNRHDPSAVMVLNSRGEKLGHLSRGRARELAPFMDRGMKVHAVVDSVTGGSRDTLGLNIHVRPG